MIVRNYSILLEWRAKYRTSQTLNTLCVIEHLFDQTSEINKLYFPLRVFEFRSRCIICLLQQTRFVDMAFRSRTTYIQTKSQDGFCSWLHSYNENCRILRVRSGHIVSSKLDREMKYKSTQSVPLFQLIYSRSHAIWTEGGKSGKTKILRWCTPYSLIKHQGTNAPHDSRVLLQRCTRGQNRARVNLQASSFTLFSEAVSDLRADFWKLEAAKYTNRLGLNHVNRYSMKRHFSEELDIAYAKRSPALSLFHSLHRTTSRKNPMVQALKGSPLVSSQIVQFRWCSVEAFFYFFRLFVALKIPIYIRVVIRASGSGSSSEASDFWLYGPKMKCVGIFTLLNTTASLLTYDTYPRPLATWANDPKIKK